MKIKNVKPTKWFHTYEANTWDSALRAALLSSYYINVNGYVIDHSNGAVSLYTRNPSGMLQVICKFDRDHCERLSGVNRKNLDHRVLLYANLIFAVIDVTSTTLKNDGNASNAF